MRADHRKSSRYTSTFLGVCVFAVCTALTFFSVTSYAAEDGNAAQQPTKRTECTTIIVGKNASADGTAFYGRTDDGEDFDVTTIKNNPATHHGSEWTYTDPHNGGQYVLPANGCQYMSTPQTASMGDGAWDEAALNEYGVSCTETETIYGGDAVLAADPYVKTGVAESSMGPIVMPYIHTAKEGVERLGNLINEYGSAEGNAVMFGDANELWWMEIYSGHQWAAVKFPDDKCAVIANDGLIGPIDVSDAENVIVSPNLVSIAKDNGFYQETNGKLDLTLTFCEPKRDYAQIRVWAGHKKFSPSTTGDYDVNKTYDFAFTPDEKISIADAMEFLRYRYEDLKYNANKHPEVRAVGIGRTATAHVINHRGKDLPPILWTCLANPEMSVFMPVYSNTYYLPSAYTIDSCDYNPDMAYWKFRRISALAMKDRDGFGKSVRNTWRQKELDLVNNTKKRDEEYLSAGATPQAASKIFDEISSDILQTADALWVDGLEEFMLSTMQDGTSDASDESYNHINFDAPDDEESVSMNPFVVSLISAVAGLVVGVGVTVMVVVSRKNHKKSPSKAQAKKK